MATSEDGVMSKAVREIILDEDSTDPLVQQYDDLISLLAGFRDFAFATSDARKRASTITRRLANLARVLHRGLAPVRKADVTPLLERRRKLDLQVLARDENAKVLKRLWNALPTPEPTHVELRDAFLQHLQSVAFDVRLLGPTRIEDAAKEFVDELLWPELRPRLVSENGMRLLVATLRDLARAGSARKPAGDPPLDQLLKHLKIAVSRDALKSARRRRRRRS